ncbi:MAG TPA: hypothetical protein VG518_00415, partial [Solirubrobacterales bacterium]|nr:hypothetical protein [Solirubrobacterales bacterium]
ILVSLGGDSLGKGGDTDASPRRDVDAIAQALASLAAENEMVLAHGIGPRLDIALRNALPDRDLLTVIAEVIVSADDPALAGRSEEGERGARLQPPAPEPSAIAALRGLRILIEAGVIVVCGGAGLVPITLDSTGAMHGVDAPVDNDLTAALLARRLDADLLVVLTEARPGWLDQGSAEGRGLRAISPAQLRKMGVPAGPLSSKVEAACRFVDATGRRAVIGAITDAAEIVRGVAGIQVSAQPPV